MSISESASLPPGAKAKLGALADGHLLAVEAVQSTQRRIRELQDQVNALNGQPEAADIEFEISRLRSVLAQHQQRFRDLASVVGIVRRWLEQQPPHRFFEDAPLTKVRLKKGETIMEALKRIRDQIIDLTAEKQRVFHAGPPVEDLKTQARQHVDELAAKVSLNVKADRGPFSFSIDTGGFGPSAVSLMAWLNGDTLKKRLIEHIEKTAKKDALQLTAEERSVRLSDLTSQLRALGHDEEALIIKARDEGTEIMRRPDVDAQCVLGIRRAAAKVAA